MGGFIAVSRDFWNDPDFDDGAPMTQREAWLWMIAEAAWKPRKVRRGSVVIELDRGQLAHSVRFMAEAWGWHRARVERFLKSLKNRDIIETKAETGATVITVCNYDKYQSGPEAGETATKREPRQGRDSAETNENKDNKDNKDLLDSLSPAETHHPDPWDADQDFNRIYDAYRAVDTKKRSARKEAWRRFVDAVKQDGRERVVGGIESYLASPKVREDRQGGFVAGLQVFINKGKHLDWYEQRPKTGAKAMPEKESLTQRYGGFI